MYINIPIFNLYFTDYKNSMQNEYFNLTVIFKKINITIKIIIINNKKFEFLY